MDKKTKKEIEPHKEVWDVLSKIDCSKHVEKKMGLTYLSWAWAWGIVMDHFPDTQFEVMYFADPTNETKKYPYEIHPDGSATVWVKIYIYGVFRKMWLPVMDNRNNAIKNPNARQISDTTMRCLVKGLALFGLGHYIFAGEDLPESAEKEVVTKSTEVAPKSQLAHVFQGWEELANLYLMELKWIKKGQTWKNISDANAKKVIARPQSFKEKAEAHAASSN